MSETILIVRAVWNDSLTKPLAEGAQLYCQSKGYASDIVEVPGSLEIPLALLWHLKATPYVGAIACGVVIQGDTLHFDLVARDCSRALMDLSLKFEIPIGNALLPVYTIDQAMERIGGSKGHKGKEAAAAVMRMLDLRNSIGGR